jgi:hypothetical protein
VKDQNAQQLLAKVMGWTDEDTVKRFVPNLQLLSQHKFDSYQQFGPGKRFIESLALWLNQFDPTDRDTALNFIREQLIFLSDREISHLVEMAYPDVIANARAMMVAEEQSIPAHRITQLINHPRYKELRLKTLYLGLSDGARTNELRRGSAGEIGNEQIWQAYELGQAKSQDMKDSLVEALSKSDLPTTNPKFNIVWLLDDFSGSGNTYIRYDSGKKKFKGKIKKIYEQLHQGGLVDTSHYDPYLLLYVATRQAIDHIEYWSERFTSEQGYKPLQLRVLYTLEKSAAINNHWPPELQQIIGKPRYYDHGVWDKHMEVGGGSDARLGFAECALPLVLSHNTPNNSIYMLWAPESMSFYGLFPRVSRHREV